jgi:hypothetical protein
MVEGNLEGGERTNRYSHGYRLLRKTTENIRIAGNPAESRTGYRYMELLGVYVDTRCYHSRSVLPIDN